MIKEKKYKIIHYYTSYSKKKGTIEKKTILKKDLTEIGVIFWVNEHYPKQLEIKIPGSFKVDGFLYPGKIEIK